MIDLDDLYATCVSVYVLNFRKEKQRRSENGKAGEEFRKFSDNQIENEEKKVGAVKGNA